MISWISGDLTGEGKWHNSFGTNIILIDILGYSLS